MTMNTCKTQQYNFYFWNEEWNINNINTNQNATI